MRCCESCLPFTLSSITSGTAIPARHFDSGRHAMTPGLSANLTLGLVQVSPAYARNVGYSLVQALGVDLLQSDGITTAGLATLQHRGVHPDISSVVLSCSAQDTRILWEIALRQRRHHAAGAGTGNAQSKGIADRERLSDPSILHEILLGVRSLHNDVWAKAPDFETPLRIQCPQPIERGRGQQMHERTVEESTLRQIEVGDGVPMIEARDIRPVLLSCGRLHIGQCRQFHFTLEPLREYLVEVALLAVNDGAIRKGDADRRPLRTSSWNVSERGTAIEQARPFPWVLGACNLPVGAVHERIGEIS